MLGQVLVVLLQLTSHLHELAQSILGHADDPLQLILHRFAPQLIPRHEDDPLQSMSQPMPWLQSMSAQAFALLHLIVQSKPAGHWTEPHGVLALHSILHVLAVRLQDVHGLGHGASTQYPFSQVRSRSRQSLLVLQA